MVGGRPSRSGRAQGSFIRPIPTEAPDTYADLFRTADGVSIYGLNRWLHACKSHSGQHKLDHRPTWSQDVVLTDGNPLRQEPRPERILCSANKRTSGRPKPHHSARLRRRPRFLLQELRGAVPRQRLAIICPRFARYGSQFTPALQAKGEDAREANHRSRRLVRRQPGGVANKEED